MLIEVQDITKTYIMGDSEVHALRGVSLGVEHGEFVAVMGPSGSGKSTLMHLIGCLDRPSTGHYTLDGTPVEDLDDVALSALRNRKISFVFQSFNLISQLSVAENVEVPLIYRGTPREEREQLAAQKLASGGLAHRRNHRPNERSGGECQRVAIAPGGSLGVLDWLSRGRRLRGERWAFRRYSSRLDVHIGGAHVLCESLRLDPSRSPVGSEFKTGGFDCLAVVGLFGEKVVDAVSTLLDMISGQPFEPGQEILEAVSPVAHGAVLRVMGSTPELVGRYLDEKLGFLAELIGESPWSRKW